MNEVQVVLTVLSSDPEIDSDIPAMIGASAANVFQAREEVRRIPLFSMLTWSMVAGAVMDSLIALVIAGPPVFDGSELVVTKPIIEAGSPIGAVHVRIVADGPQEPHAVGVEPDERRSVGERRWTRAP